MSTLYIREIESVASVPGGQLQIWPEPGSVDQTVTVSGVSAQSAAFGTKTRYIAITCDGIYSYLVGSNPTATTAKFRVPADQILVVQVQPGDKIAAITNT